ncbi:unnamed protein product, partial [Gadus morhua 'NCC']
CPLQAYDHTAPADYTSAGACSSSTVIQGKTPPRVGDRSPRYLCSDKPGPPLQQWNTHVKEDEDAKSASCFHSRRPPSRTTAASVDVEPGWGAGRSVVQNYIFIAIFSSLAPIRGEVREGTRVRAGDGAGCGGCIMEGVGGSEPNRRRRAPGSWLRGPRNATRKEQERRRRDGCLNTTCVPVARCRDLR